MKIDHLAQHPSSVWTWCGYNVLRHRPRTQGRIFYSDAEFDASERRCPDCVDAHADYLSSVFDEELERERGS